MGIRDALIGAEARELVREDRTMPLEREQLRLWERARSLRTLERECDSWGRLGAGLVAWGLAVLGVAGVALALWDGAPAALRVLGSVGGVGLLAAGAAVGWAVWRAGRAVVDAFCWWTHLPARVPDPSGTDWGASRAYDAVHARVFIFQGKRPVRLVLGAVAFLVPFLFLLLATGSGDGGGATRFTEPLWPTGQGASLTVTVLLLLAVCWTAGTLTMGGLVRAHAANSRRDPVQSAIIGAFRRGR